MEKRLMTFLACLFLSIGMALAQTQVSGKVTSAEDGSPVIGASVKVVGTNTGTVTDTDGNFSLNAPAGAKLVISYIGMQSKTVKASNNMNISLDNDDRSLEEVVVTGYGVQKKASFTGAASLLDGAAIEKKSDANFVKSLEGNVSGIQMNNSTGQPGSWGSVYVRGRGSLNSGTQPLYVIDGMPVSSDYDGMSSSSNNWIDPMASVNPEDIETVTVLKDAAATAIYGSRASNGVIVITTKKGKEGKLNINVDVKQGFSYRANNNMEYANAEQTMDLFAKGYVAAVSTMLPFYPLYDENGDYYGYRSVYNPMATTDSKLGDINESKNETINLNPYLQIDIWNGIYYRTNFGANISNYREYQYWSAIYNTQGRSYNGLGQQYNSRTTTLTWNNIIGWNHTFNELHTISAILGQEMQKKSYYYEYYTGDDFPFASLGMTDLSTVGHWGDSEFYKKEARLASYFADVHYSYSDKYYASASFRRDGSSVFGMDNRWGNFWSIGAKWRLSSETFLKDNPVITNATLRASYGTVGNQDIDWYAARGFYNSGYNYNGQVGIAPVSISNDKLTWETSKKFDIGFDLSLIDRIHLSLDYYNETTSDALMEVPLSMTTGLTDAYQNIGKIRNQGIEVDMKFSIIHKKNLDWSAYANLTWNKNKVIKLASGDPIIGTYNIVKEGYAYNTFYMKEYAGVDKSNGKPLWYLNETGDETTSNYNEATKRLLGSPDPKVFGGFGTSVNWNGLDASISFNYRLGAKVYDSGARYTGWGMSNRTPLKEMALNSWTEENPDAKYPQYIYGDPNNAAQASSRFLYNANYLRLSNVTVGYTLPSVITKKAFMEKVRIYVSADNVYTFTSSDFYGYTPETYASGVIAWQYPAVATFVGGIQITF